MSTSARPRTGQADVSSGPQAEPSQLQIDAMNDGAIELGRQMAGAAYQAGYEAGRQSCAHGNKIQHPAHMKSTHASLVQEMETQIAEIRAAFNLAPDDDVVEWAKYLFSVYAVTPAPVKRRLALLRRSAHAKENTDVEV